MRCKCGNKLDIVIAARLQTKGCSVLTSSVCAVVVKCNKCGRVMQVPLTVDVSKETRARPQQSKTRKPESIKTQKKNTKKRRKKAIEPEIRYIG
ncbi:MAG: hypothetical protein J7K31_01810 [Candidatus Aenigmarchaeota archaeon]|nr:hypothetical protein [Candidatus Aenigmarchaeota archaeon]